MAKKLEDFIASLPQEEQHAIHETALTEDDTLLRIRLQCQPYLITIAWSVEDAAYLAGIDGGWLTHGPTPLHALLQLFEVIDGIYKMDDTP